MSKQRTLYRTEQELLDHRQKVIKKLEKVQGLQALLADWEQNPQDTREYHDYIRELKERLRQARNRYLYTKP